jgi:hypothetical protein
MAAQMVQGFSACNHLNPEEQTRGHESAEARQFVKKMYDGARAYYMDPGMAGGLTPLAAQFLTATSAMTPPAGSCCKGNDGKCQPSAALWSDPVWVALQFSVDDPHYYSYQYETSDPLKSFVVRATGDIDCDGKYSTFELRGEINADHPDGPAGEVKMTVVDELE